MVNKQTPGFPRPSSLYWNESTLEAVRQRYEPWGMDINPYKQSVEKNKSIISKL